MPVLLRYHGMIFLLFVLVVCLSEAKNVLVCSGLWGKMGGI